MRVGVISDTHGLLRPQALAALAGSDHIIHAGDVVDPAILDRLRETAPVTAVRGNCDHGEWARALPMSDTVELAGVLVHVIHIREDLDLDPKAAGVQVVITGHTHQPRVVEEDGVLHLNPGSAGPRRFTLPVTVAVLELEAGRVEARLVELVCG